MSSMKVYIVIYILIVSSFLSISAMFAEPITVLNPSFEYVNGQPVTVKTMGVTPDDWTFTSGNDNDGIEDPSSDGEVCVAVGTTDSVYQLLDHTIAAGDEYTLTFDTYFLWGAPNWECTFQGRLYYDDAGNREVIDYVEDGLPADWTWHTDYTMTVAIPSGSPAVGNKLGIDLYADAPVLSWVGFDNVRLDAVISNRAIGPYPADGQNEVTLDTVLSWEAPPGFVDPTFDVYFSEDEDAVATASGGAFKGNQSTMNYTPESLQMATRYYWRIDIVDQSIVYPGAVWHFTTYSEEPDCLALTTDVNVDCITDLTDVLILAEQWLEEVCVEPWCADIDVVGGVNMSDFALIAEDWGKGGIDLVINEFMASNTITWTDDDGFYSDWIELKNLSTESKNLKDYALTDSISDPTGWRIPDISIEPGECKIIYASSNDRTDPNYPLHTDFNLGISGNYLALLEPDGSIVHAYTPQYPPQAEDISYGLTVPLGEDRFTYGYFLEPSPGANNVSTATANLGPYIENVTHLPSQPTAAEDVNITALLKTKVGDVGSVTLYYRVMFGAEVALTMYDDGAHNDEAADDGIYGCTISAGAATAGQMLRYRIVATDVDGRENTAPLSLDSLGMRQSPEYYGTVVADPGIFTDLPVLYWFVQDTAAANTRTGARASLYYNGEFYDNIFVRLRGGTIAWLPKKSYKFEFNKGYYFRFRPDEARVDEFNLNASYPDKAYIRQQLCFETFRDVGSPYSITFPMRVQRNDDFFSVAFFIEQPDEDYLIRQQMDPEGALYKMYSDMTYDSSEKKTRLYEDHSDLLALINGIALTGDAEEYFLFDNVNIPTVVNYAAACTLVNDYDHGRKNYYAYRDTNGTREWLYLPWDKDLTLGKMWDNDLGLLNDTLYYYNPWGGSIESDTLENGGNNALLGSIFSNSRTREMYFRRLRSIFDQLLKAPGTDPSELHYENRSDELYTLMNPDVILDYNEWCNPWGYGEDQSFAEAIGYLKDDYLEPRRTLVYVARSVDNGGPFPHAQVGNPTINFGMIEFNPESGNQDQEYIELVNPNSDAVDVSGWQLAGAVGYTFIGGTVIPAGESLYVSPDVTAFRARTTSPKGNEGNFVQGNYKGHLSSWGETINLLAADSSLVNTITYPGDPSEQQLYLRITELMYHPAQGQDYNEEEYEYIELKNIGTGAVTLDSIKFTNGIYYEFTPGGKLNLTAGQCMLIVKNQDAFASRYDTADMNIAPGIYDGYLSNGGEQIKLEDYSNSTILEFGYDDSWYDITDGGGFSLTIKDPNNLDLDSWDTKSAWRPSLYSDGSPGEDDAGDIPPIGSIVINEILAHSDTLTYDWIELYNTTGAGIDISGWFLSDSNNDDPNRMKYEIPAETIIDANDYVVFNENLHFGNESAPGCNIPFQLSENGETVYLQSGSDGVLTGYYEEEKFGASGADIALGRYQKSTGAFNFVAMSSNTPGSANAYPKVGPIVITEIMYHPEINADAEYVELLNIGEEAITLYNNATGEPWRFVDDEDNLGIEYYFPSLPEELAAIDPNEKILLIKNAVAFKLEFGETSLDGITYYEWLDGSLSNGGEKPELQQPGDVDVLGTRYYIRVDRVSYDDEYPWPTSADGLGDSLTRISNTAYGNDVINWQGDSPSPDI